MPTNITQAQERILRVVNTPSSKTPPPSSLSDHHLALLITAVIQEGVKRLESKDYITDKVLRLIRENKEGADNLSLTDDFVRVKQTLVEPNYLPSGSQPLTKVVQQPITHVAFQPLINVANQPITNKGGRRPIVWQRTEQVSVPGGKEKIEVPKKDSLPPDFGTKPGQSLKNKFDALEKEMTARLEEYRQKLSGGPQGLSPQLRNYYQDLVNAISRDLKELKEGRKSESREDKINLYNRLSYEFHLEVKFNVDLTGNLTKWSLDDLRDLEEQLEMLPEKLTSLNPRLRQIEIKEQKKGVGGTNNGKGYISIEPGLVEWALIHEIGHDFDDENPYWKKFKALSGWKDITNKFKDISDDKTNGALDPYGGSATLKRDGKVYRDKDQIDLDGDGKIDGIVQIHYGRVMIYDLTATFIEDSNNPRITDYSSTNPKDDFAETFKYFFTLPNELKKVSPKKFWFMVDFVGYDPTAQTGKQSPKYV